MTPAPSPSPTPPRAACSEPRSSTGRRRAIHGLELGYIIHSPADRRRGAASEAVRLFADYLFEARPDVYRLQLVIEAWNVASWKLAERCGFVREGLMRSAGFGAGDPADCFLYARTRKDWHEARHSPIGLGGNRAD